ncbi:MAG: hypothetical protein ACXWH0_04415 [Acidimicrobiia bacterium]
MHTVGEGLHTQETVLDTELSAPELRGREAANSTRPKLEETAVPGGTVASLIHAAPF